MLTKINSLLWEILTAQIAPSEAKWLEENGVAEPLELMTAFVATPRFLAKRTVKPTVQQTLELNEIMPGYSVEDWGIVRLSRVWLLSCLDTANKEEYCRHLETLFDTAEMNEMVALYSALPLLEYPEKWLFRATDAVRSNMGVVFDAVALKNPYPTKHFTELAWNQLVLKAIFNDKPIHFIVGLEERVNENLAFTLSDFAHERWAAGRTVPAQVWRLVSKFLNEELLSDMEHLFRSKSLEDQQAAALTCHHSDYEPAKQLLAQYPDLEKNVHHNQLTWTHLEIY
jgi:hypothetical protein